MAPTLRSSRMAPIPLNGVRMKEDDRLSADIAQSIETEESDHEMESSELEDDFMEEAPQQQTSADLLRPLHETSERVGRQLEEFAQELDKFQRFRAQGRSESKLWEETWILMDKYQDITLKYTKSKRSRQSLGDTAKEEYNLNLEAQLWDLEAALLPCQSPEIYDSTTTAQATALVELNRYSTSSQLWKAFMECDRVASEYEALLDWL